MGFGPITGITSVAKVEPAAVDREVKPPFGLEHSDRMGEDSYRGSGDEGERGLEDEEEAPESAEAVSVSPEPESTLNFMA